MISKIKKPLSVLLSILMVVSVFGGMTFTASAAEKELTETFNLGQYGHYDEDWEEVLADAHTGENVTVAPTGDSMYVRDNCWNPSEDQWGEAIRVTVNNGDVIRKIVIKEYLYNNPWHVSVNGRTIPGTKTKIDENNNWVTFEKVNAAQALIEVPDSSLAKQLIVYYGDPLPYTVTWKNGDTVLETDEDVAYGTTPTYDGAAPTKEADTFNTYEFAGWKNGETTYAPNELPAVTGDVIYTAQFTAVPKLFAGHSVSLDGDIGVNFFINPNAADFANATTATVKFTWDGNTKEVNLKTAPMEGDCYKATCEVVAAQMAHKITAEVYINGEKLKKTDSISVQDYAEKLYNDPEKYDIKRPELLKALAKALLNYGSEAQTVLSAALTEIPEKRADVNVGQTDYSNVTADAIQTAVNAANPGKSASNLKSLAPEFGAKLYAYSLIYLSQSTLRLYFVPAEGTTMAHSDEYDGSQSNYYYYVQKTGICASELDTLQEFEINNTKFCYSALDYAKAVISSSKMTDTQKNLAKSLFLYNQAANDYFDAKEPSADALKNGSTVQVKTRITSNNNWWRTKTWQYNNGTFNQIADEKGFKNLDCTLSASGDIITLLIKYSDYSRTVTINTADNTYTETTSGGNALWESRLAWDNFIVNGKDIKPTLTKG